MEDDGITADDTANAHLIGLYTGAVLDLVTATRQRNSALAITLGLLTGVGVGATVWAVLNRK